ncbi:MAG: amidohydrolase [Acidobacteriota bacterium]|nr:amidohydrolase [Acidobacteriota bacterium]
MRADTAETIFHNGVVWTGVGGDPRATALAVSGGRIVAVGDSPRVLALRGRGTLVVDLAGQTLIPGFVDAHAHIWKIGHLLTTLLDLRGASSLTGLGAQLRERASRLAPGAWLQGRGYNEARFPDGRPPTRADLDTVVADRPVVLMRTCAHIVVCNSVALERAGIARDTATPPGGEIDRGPDGEPTGVLREAAMGLVLRHVPPPSAADYEAMVTAALRHQVSLGITSTNDAGVAPELLDRYRQMDQDGRLPIRINVMALRLVDGVGAVPLPAHHHRSDRLRIDTVKFFADGGLSGATAALSVPYRHADTRGVLRFEYDEFLALAREAHQAGWRIATHAIGDVAIDQVLRVYEALPLTRSHSLRAGGRGAMRHRIEHFGLPGADHLARAARLGVIAVPQTVFIHALGRNFRQYLPDALLARTYPVRSMLDAGVTVALSSDAPVVEDDSPLRGIQAAMLRRDEDGHGIAVGEAISLDEALDAYTRGGAIASGDDGERGCLREGMLADLAVLSGNLHETPAEEIISLRVTQTWVGGDQAYSG